MSQRRPALRPTGSALAAGASALLAACTLIVGVGDHYLRVDAGTPGDAGTGADAPAGDGSSADANGADANGADANGADADAGAYGMAVVLVANQGNPRTIAVDGTYVYWMNDGVGQGGSVMRIAKDGGGDAELLAAVAQAGELAIDDDYVYFTDDISDAGTPGLYRIAKEGGAPSLLETNDASVGYGSLALDDTYAYSEAPHAGAVTRVRRTRKDGTPETPECYPYVALTNTHLGPIAADPSGIYFGDGIYDKVYQATSTCGSGQAFVATTAEVRGVATDDASVYWTAEKSVYRLDKTQAGETATTLYTYLGSTVGIALQDAYVVVAISNGGWVWRFSKQPPRSGLSFSAPSYANFTGVAVDDAGVIFVTDWQPNGNIFRIDPPP